MPYSFVIDYYSENKLDRSNLVQRMFYALLLETIRKVDPSLSQKIHDEKKNKSITVRKIWNDDYKISLRFTFLDESMFDNFTQVIFHACHKDFSLNSNIIKIYRINATPDSGEFWANYKTYEDLYNNPSNDKSLRFNIVTPLSFKSGDLFNPLPEPKLFFKNLHDKWNTYSPYKFDDYLLDLVDKSLYIDYLDLKTDVMKDNNGISFIGSKGKFGYRVTKFSSDEFVKYVNTLADFAYYSGVGAKVSMGMGQVHRLKKSFTTDYTDKTDVSDKDKKDD